MRLRGMGTRQVRRNAGCRFWGSNSQPPGSTLKPTQVCAKEPADIALQDLCQIQTDTVYFERQIRRAVGSKGILRGFMNPATVCRVTDPRPVPGAEVRGGRLEDLWGAQPADLTSPQIIDTPIRALLACKDLRAHISHKHFFDVKWYFC